MTISGRASVALAKTESAREAFAIIVIDELQVHSLEVIFSAREAVVLRGFAERGRRDGGGGFPGHVVNNR